MHFPYNILSTYYVLYAQLQSTLIRSYNQHTGDDHPSSTPPAVSLFVVLLFLHTVLLQIVSPEEALKAICGAQDWVAMQAVVVGLNVDLHCLQSASLESLQDIPQHLIVLITDGRKY